MAGFTLGSFEQSRADEPYAGIRRRSFDSEHATVAEYVFQPGAQFPLHHHPQEQITVIEHGEIELLVAGEARALSAGDWAVVAADVEHGIRAGANGARFVATIVPRRERIDAYTVTR
ncbi:MAG TPA: cupin domain-containing protein [Conexibacter sp.]|jgi:quercetin dioxygenase-like cupin family protein